MRNQNQRLIEVGDMVECVNPQSRFYKEVGICEELDYDKYGQFCMRVTTVADRVDPCNWLITNHVEITSPTRMNF